MVASHHDDSCDDSYDEGFETSPQDDDPSFYNSEYTREDKPPYDNINVGGKSLSMKSTQKTLSDYIDARNERTSHPPTSKRPISSHSQLDNDPAEPPSSGIRPIEYVRPTSSARRILSSTNPFDDKSRPSSSAAANQNSENDAIRPSSSRNSASRVPSFSGSEREPSRPSSSIKMVPSFSNNASKESPRVYSLSDVAEPSFYKDTNHSRSTSSSKAGNKEIYLVNEQPRSSRLDKRFSENSDFSRPSSSAKGNFTAEQFSRPSSASAASNFLKIDDDPKVSNTSESNRAQIPLGASDFSRIDSGRSSTVEGMKLQSSKDQENTEGSSHRTSSSRTPSKNMPLARDSHSERSLAFYSNQALSASDYLLTGTQGELQASTIAVNNYGGIAEDSLYDVRDHDSSLNGDWDISRKDITEHSQNYLAPSVDDTTNYIDADDGGFDEVVKSSNLRDELQQVHSSSGNSDIFEDTPKSPPVAPKKPVRFSDWDD